LFNWIEPHCILTSNGYCLSFEGKEENIFRQNEENIERERYKLTGVKLVVIGTLLLGLDLETLCVVNLHYLFIFCPDSSHNKEAISQVTFVPL